jgi:opacity protein-like surface antigen
MLRRFLVAATLTVLAATAASAETYADKVKAVDTDKKTLTIPVDGKDTVFSVDDKVDVQKQTRAGKRLRNTPVKDGLKGVNSGNEVTITTEKRDGQEVVTKIVLLLSDK